MPTETNYIICHFSKDVNLDNTVLLCLLGKARNIDCNPNFRIFSLYIKSRFTSFEENVQNFELKDIENIHH